MPSMLRNDPKTFPRHQLNAAMRAARLRTVRGTGTADAQHTAFSSARIARAGTIGEIRTWSNRAKKLSSPSACPLARRTSIPRLTRTSAEAP